MNPKDIKTINDDVVDAVYVTAISEKDKWTSIESRIDGSVKFRLKHGYSKTMFKLMQKYGCKSVEEYRLIRKANRKARK
jgi:hypothetical protein